MKNYITKLSVGAMAAFGLASAACAACADDSTTTIEVVNATSSDITLKQHPNISGSLEKDAPQTIRAEHPFQTTSMTSNSTSDAGILYYGKCRFNWSTIKSTNLWTHQPSWSFSQMASPGSTCQAEAVTADPKTGKHSVKFTVKG